MSLCAHSDTLRPLLPHDGSLQCVCWNAKAVSASTVSRVPASKASATISASALLDVSISASIDSSNSCASVEDCFAALRSSSNRPRLRAFLPPHLHVVVPPHQLLGVCAQSSMKVPRSVHLFQVLVVVPVCRYQFVHRSVLCPGPFSCLQLATSCLPPIQVRFLLHTRRMPACVVLWFSHVLRTKRPPITCCQKRQCQLQFPMFV